MDSRKPVGPLRYLNDRKVQFCRALSWRRAIRASATLLALVLLSTAQNALAQVHDMKDRAFSADDVKRALARPPTETSALPRTPSNAGDQPAPSGRRTRGIGVVSAGTAAMPTVADATRKLSMQLQFAYDSADLTNSARERLDAVGTALVSPELESGKFVISGHTDAIGSYAYNLALSKRRAEAVKSYLVSRHGVREDRIIPVGKASDELLDAADPKNPANRRVQLESLN